jgi:hypothetical protein
VKQPSSRREACAARAAATAAFVGRREVRAAAVADQGNAPARALVDVGEPGVQALERAIGAVDVEDHPGAVWLVADPLEPAVHDAQRHVAGQEPGHQQRGQPVLVRDAVAAEHRVHEQPRELGLPADLRERAAPPAAGLGGRGGGDGGVEPGVVEDLRHAGQATPAAGPA